MAQVCEETFSEFVRSSRRWEVGPCDYAMVTKIEGYFDDSQDEKGQRYCASGGFVGSPEQWDAFLFEWSRETSDLKKPFHVVDCEGGRDKNGREFGYDQFSDWPKEKRVRLITRLVDIIQDVQLGGFASIVPIQAYNAAFPNCAPGDPYLLTIPHTIMNMAYLADRSKLDLKMCFEEGGPVGFIGQTYKAIRRMNWGPSKRLEGLIFHGKSVYALQAADLIAREAFKHLDNLGVRPMRKPLLRIGESIFFIAWTEASLRYLAANGGPGNLELLAHWDEYPDAPKLAWHSLWLAKRGKK